mgnify:CR=1 FL=1
MIIFTLSMISKNLKITLLPAVHWSKRGLFDRNKMLWLELTKETHGRNVYFIGDSGYDDREYLRMIQRKIVNFI